MNGCCKPNHTLARHYRPGRGHQTQTLSLHKLRRSELNDLRTTLQSVGLLKRKSPTRNSTSDFRGTKKIREMLVLVYLQLQCGKQALLSIYESRNRKTSSTHLPSVVSRTKTLHRFSQTQTTQKKGRSSSHSLNPYPLRRCHCWLPLKTAHLADPEHLRYHHQRCRACSPAFR